MNVKELMERLNELPLDAEVCVSEPCGDETRNGEYWLVDLDFQQSAEVFGIENKVMLRGME